MSAEPSGTITPAEWSSATLEPVLARLQCEWPWLGIQVRGEGGAATIDVQSSTVLGFVGLVHDPHMKGGYIPAGRIGSSSTLGGPVPTARTRAREALAVCDALDTGVSMLDGVRVWWP